MLKVNGLLLFLLGMLSCFIFVKQYESNEPTPAAPVQVANAAEVRAPAVASSTATVTHTKQENPYIEYLRTSAKRFPVSPVKGLSFFNPTYLERNILLNQVQLQMSLKELNTVKKDTLIEFLTNYVKLVERVNCEYHSEILKKGAKILNFLTSREGAEFDRALPTLVVQDQRIDLIKGFETTSSDCKPYKESDTSLVKNFASPREQLLDFFQEQKPRSSGTGWPLENGLVVTNHHVINNASRIYLLKSDHTFVEARVLFSDSFRDIALLKVDVPDFLPPSLPISAHEYDIGGQVFTIGYPWTSGLSFNEVPQPQLSRGVISAIPDNGAQYQLSMAVHGGNSGGALFNGRGEVIGIINSKLAKGPSEDTPQDVSFAIKASQLDMLLKDFTSEKRLSSLKVDSNDLEVLAPQLKHSVLMVIVL